MGLGWSGFLMGTGQGLDKAVDNWTAQKKFAQTLAQQQAQQQHLVNMDNQAQQNYQERLLMDQDKIKTDKERDDRADVMASIGSMPQDSVPMSSLPQNYQDTARKAFAPMISQPTSQPSSGMVSGLPTGQSPQVANPAAALMGAPSGQNQVAVPPQAAPPMAAPDDASGMAPAGPQQARQNFGGEILNRPISPGERASDLRNKTALAGLQTRIDINDAVNSRYRDINANTVYGRSQDAANRLAAETAAKAAAKDAKDEAAKTVATAQAGRFAADRAQRNYQDWYKTSYAADDKNIDKNYQSPNYGKPLPLTPDTIANKKLEFFRDALGPNYDASQFPQHLNYLGITGQPPVAPPPQGPPAAPPPWASAPGAVGTAGRIPLPPMMPSHAGAPAAPQAGGGPIVVVDPKGTPHPFATQEQADAFKRLAGIK